MSSPCSELSPCPGCAEAVISNPPKLRGARIAAAAIHINSPPSHPTCARHKCWVELSRSASNNVAPVVVRLDTIST